MKHQIQFCCVIFFLFSLYHLIFWSFLTFTRRGGESIEIKYICGKVTQRERRERNLEYQNCKLEYQEGKKDVSEPKALKYFLCKTVLRSEAHGGTYSSCFQQEPSVSQLKAFQGVTDKHHSRQKMQLPWRHKWLVEAFSPSTFFYIHKIFT